MESEQASALVAKQTVESRASKFLVGMGSQCGFRGGWCPTEVSVFHKGSTQKLVAFG